MKNGEINLDILENADGKTVERLSAEYKAVSDSDISRLYARSKELYKNKTAKNSDEYSTSVSGVEVYHRPVWKKVLTFAAALVLMGSAVTGATIFYKNNFTNKDGGVSSTGSIKDYIGSTQEIPYETILENGKFTSSYDNFTCDSNPLQISGAPYRDAVVAKPFKSVLVDKDSVVAPLNEWLFPVVSGTQYVGFVNCDMRLLGNNELSFWGGQMYAPKLNEALKKGSIALFDTVDGTYGIYEDNTVIELMAGGVSYNGNITFEQVNQGYNLVTADSASDIVYGPMSKEWGITLKAAEVTPTGLTIECTQSGGKKVHELSTGSYFVIQKFSGGVWEDVEYLPHEEELVWTSESWIIQKEATTSWNVQWDQIYGELPSGNYRIGKEIMNLREPGAFIEGFAYAEFTIYNANDTDDNIFSPTTHVIENKKANYNINENGQTYGIGDAEDVEELPDLVSVIGDNDIKGYVYSKELMEKPSNPDEAMEHQKALENGTYKPKVYTVYESDGKTVIDTFTEYIPDGYLY